MKPIAPLRLFYPLAIALIAMLSLQTQAVEPLKPFKAHYKSTIRLGWFSVGVKAIREFKQQNDGNWLLNFTAEASIAKVVETSLMSFKDGQYQPISYRYRATGLVDEPDQTLKFKATNKQVDDLENNKTFNLWNEKIQDNISYMMQASLDLMADKKTLSYPVFERRKIKNFEFQIVAEEQLKTGFGTLGTLKIKLLGSPKNEQIHAWLAKDYQYLLVRLQETRKGKTRYKIELTDLKM